MDWAAWSPTIVTVLGWAFFTGVIWSTLKSHGSHLSEHDKQLEDHTKDITTLTVEVGVLKAFREGYATARAIYERQPQHETGD
jgi:predicted secreted protein